MMTTKEIAELFSQEIERISKGDVRKEVITGLEKCSNALIKLARLEMDFAWKDWDGQRPNVPWIASQLKQSRESDQNLIGTISEPDSTVQKRTKAQHIESQLANLRKELSSASITRVKIIEDKIKHFESALARECINKDLESDEHQTPE